MSQLDLNVLDKQISTDPYLIVEFKGKLDKANIDDVKPALNNFINSCTDPYLIFDLRYFEYVNSEGIGFLVSLFYALESKNQKLFLLKPQPQVLDCFEAVGLTKIISIHELLEDIINQL
ncbi:STAS domain-containing protein [bacterium]|jgi:anti-anti-sigma factor|nr:STAS domain-containing protein [bacterium]MBT6293846.1 STAS domain-containing protein [bacterium]